MLGMKCEFEVIGRFIWVLSDFAGLIALLVVCGFIPSCCGLYCCLVCGFVAGV